MDDSWMILVQGLISVAVSGWVSLGVLSSIISKEKL